MSLQFRKHFVYVLESFQEFIVGLFDEAGLQFSVC